MSSFAEPTKRPPRSALAGNIQAGLGNNGPTIDNLVGQVGQQNRALAGGYGTTPRPVVGVYGDPSTAAPTSPRVSPLGPAPNPGAQFNNPAANQGALDTLQRQVSSLSLPAGVTSGPGLWSPPAAPYAPPDGPSIDQLVGQVARRQVPQGVAPNQNAMQAITQALSRLTGMRR